LKASIKGYYYQRSGESLERKYAGEYARPAAHLDTHVMVHPSAASPKRPAGTIISSPKGWYDAGDYNKYIVNSGFTLGLILQSYQLIRIDSILSIFKFRNPTIRYQISWMR
jgi:endoglucanase